MLRKSLLTVFAIFRITLHHLIAVLKAGQGHFQNSVLLMAGFFGGKERSIGREREMNAGESDNRISQL